MENTLKLPSTSSPLSPNKRYGVAALIGGLILLVLTFAAGYSFGMKNAAKQGSVAILPEPSSSPSSEEGTVCTMDAKICPDGSSVGRTGPNCEFAECPKTDTRQLPATQATRTRMGISFLLPKDFAIISDTAQKVEVGTQTGDTIVYLTFIKNNTLDLKSLPKCAESSVFPCLNKGSDWGQTSDIEELSVGGKPSKSFYVSTGSVDSAQHIVQVANEFEARMNVAGGGLDGKFTGILWSLSFSK